MIKHYVTAFLAFFSISICLAQQIPINFSSNTDIFESFDGSSFSRRPNPNDASDTVGQFHNNGNSQWQGFKINLSTPINLNEEQKITLDFYQFDPNQHTILVKLENGGINPDVQVERIITAGNANVWQNNIVFNFETAKLSSDNTTKNASGSYNKLVIFIDGGVTTPGTYLINNIKQGSLNSDNNNTDTNEVVYDNLVWSDEFDGTSLDKNKWHQQTIGILNGGWANGEFQHYTDSEENAFVSEGNLHIVAKKETLFQNDVSRDYTSARLNSKFAFTYGRVDVRAKLPKGNGTWPAIWTLGKNINEVGSYWETKGFGTTSWPACGEIDIMEHGLHATNIVSSALHTPSSFGGTVNTATKPLENVSENFHIYSVNWSPTKITFLVDNVAYYTYNPIDKNSATWPFDLEQFLILNVAIGGFSGTPDANFTQSSMLVDYVRIYQNTTASSNNDFNTKFTIYPNPTSNNLHINTNKFIHKIEIYSLLGKSVLQKTNTLNRVNVSNLTAGVYFLKIYADDKVATKKIMVKK